MNLWGFYLEFWEAFGTMGAGVLLDTGESAVAIEPRDGKFAYVYSCSALIREFDTERNTIIHRTVHSMILDSADSEDEAYGRAMQAANRLYPPKSGWTNHHAIMRRIDGIDWVGRHRLNEIKPAE